MQTAEQLISIKHGSQGIQGRRISSALNNHEEISIDNLKKFKLII